MLAPYETGASILYWSKVQGHWVYQEYRSLGAVASVLHYLKEHGISCDLKIQTQGEYVHEHEHAWDTVRES